MKEMEREMDKYVDELKDKDRDLQILSSKLELSEKGPGYRKIEELEEVILAERNKRKEAEIQLETIQNVIKNFSQHNWSQDLS